MGSGFSDITLDRTAAPSADVCHLPQIQPQSGSPLRTHSTWTVSSKLPRRWLPKIVSEQIGRHNTPPCVDGGFLRWLCACRRGEQRILTAGATVQPALRHIRYHVVGTERGSQCSAAGAIESSDTTRPSDVSLCDAQSDFDAALHLM